MSKSLKIISVFLKQLFLASITSYLMGIIQGAILKNHNMKYLFILQ